MHEVFHDTRRVIGRRYEEDKWNVLDEIIIIIIFHFNLESENVKSILILINSIENMLGWVDEK